MRLSATSRGLEVRKRAGERCEYCRMHQALQGGSFHIDHVVPRRLGGKSELPNLALACPGCNLGKGDRVQGRGETGKAIPLFNPRAHRWEEHFQFDQYKIIGLTAIGRATILTLNFNHPRRLQIRRAESLFDLFPPEPQASKK